MGESKYGVMKEATEKQVLSYDMSINDKVEQKRLEGELARIDEETEQRIKEIKATPINAELLKKQALAELDSKKKANARKKQIAIQDAEYSIKQAELDVEEAKREAEQSIRQAELSVQRQKSSLGQVKDVATELEERDNLSAQQDYENIISSIGNTDKTIELKVEREKQLAKARKKEIEIKLETIKAKNDSQADKQKCWKTLYEDIKAIGLALGDGTK